MAVAITPFEAMCGFRSIAEIAKHLTAYPELAACVSDEAKSGIESTSDQDTDAVKATHSLHPPRSRTSINSLIVIHLPRNHNDAASLLCRWLSKLFWILS